MLYGKITPEATFVTQVTPFETSSVNAGYITALARPYGLGSKKINFEVIFGNVTQSEDGSQKFERVSSYMVKFNDLELSTWGTDDSVVLTKIGEKLNTTITEIITINDDRPF